MKYFLIALIAAVLLAIPATIQIDAIIYTKHLTEQYAKQESEHIKELNQIIKEVMENEE